MIDRILKIIPWFIGIIIFINVLLLDFWSLEKTGQPLIVNETPKTSETLNCANCQEIISEEVKKALPEMGNISVSLTPTPTAKTTPIPTPTTTISSSAKVMYIPIGTTGTTVNTDWTDASGTDFYFNLADYSGVKNVRWELSLQTESANNSGYARLYDVTNKRGVDNSQLSTNLAAYEFLRSGDLTVWGGNNLYRIQLKGLNGNVVNLLNPKLKIVFN